MLSLKKTLLISALSLGTLAAAGSYANTPVGTGANAALHWAQGHPRQAYGDAKTAVDTTNTVVRGVQSIVDSFQARTGHRILAIDNRSGRVIADSARSAGGRVLDYAARQRLRPVVNIEFSAVPHEVGGY